MASNSKQGRKKNIGSLEVKPSAVMFGIPSEFHRIRALKAAPAFQVKDFILKASRNVLGACHWLFDGNSFKDLKRTIVFISAPKHKNYFNTMCFGFQVSTVQITVVYLHIWPVSV